MRVLAPRARPAALDNITRGFDVLGGGVLPGCCGALDGYLPKITRPPVDNDMTRECNVRRCGRAPVTRG